MVLTNLIAIAVLANGQISSDDIINKKCGRYVTGEALENLIVGSRLTHMLGEDRTVEHFYKNRSYETYNLVPIRGTYRALKDRICVSVYGSKESCFAIVKNSDGQLLNSSYDSSLGRCLNSPIAVKPER